MDLDQLKQIWQGLPEEIREEIRGEILGPEIAAAAARVKAARI